MPADESDDEWRFSVEEFDDPPSGDGDSSVARDADDTEADANVAGEFSPEVPVVPELPRLENAVFVTLGAILAVLAIAAVAGGPSFDLVDAFVVAAIVAVLGAIAYGAFVRLTPDT